MALSIDLSDYSEEELRGELNEKLRVANQARLNQYRRTGRAFHLVPDIEPSITQAFTTVVLNDDRERSRNWPRTKGRIGNHLLLLIEALSVVVFLALVLNGT